MIHCSAFCVSQGPIENEEVMKIFKKMTGIACLAIGLGLFLPQTAEAQFKWRSSGNDQNLVERLAGLDQYSTLVTAVTEAGLVDALSEIDQATIFAPTNEAFAKIPAESLSALLADKEALGNLLTYHVVAGRLSSYRLGNQTLTALNEGTLEISRTRHRSFWWFSSTIKVNDSTVIKANLRAKNGIIHGIDTVLDPSFEPPQSILDIAAGDENFSTLATLLQEAGLDRALDSDRLELTVFAPTNEAFEKLPAEVLEAVRNDPKLLGFVLRNHIVRGSVKSSDLETGEVRSVARTNLDVVVGDDAITVGPATVVAADIMASNGVVHVINEVLVPETVETLIGVVESRDELATFKTVLELTGYGPFFDRKPSYWNWTFFAPSNDAFNAIPADALSALIEDKRALRGVLRRHIAFGKITSADLADGAEVRTLGNRLAVQIGEGGVTFNGAPLVEADLEASNGVIHIIGGVLPQDPPSAEE